MELNLNQNWHVGMFEVSLVTMELKHVKVAANVVVFEGIGKNWTKIKCVRIK